jgi:hypothetical protein
MIFRNSNKFLEIYIGKTISEIEKQGTVLGRQFGPWPQPNEEKPADRPMSSVVWSPCGARAWGDAVARSLRACRWPELKTDFTAATSAARGWHRARRGRQKLTEGGW